MSLTENVSLTEAVSATETVSPTENVPLAEAVSTAETAPPAETMALRVMDSAAAAAALSAAGEAARGFLGLDPVTQNEPLLAAALARMHAEVYAADGDAEGDALVGFAPASGQPRQMLVATTSARPEPVAALLAFLRTYCRASSYLAQVPAGNPSAAAFEGCGLAPIGVLREHWYQSGEYRDVTLYYVKAADAWRS